MLNDINILSIKIMKRNSILVFCLDFRNLETVLYYAFQFETKLHTKCVTGEKLKSVININNE